MRKKGIFALLFVFIWVAPLSAADSLRGLISQQKFQAAYEQAKQQQAKRAGEPSFDFYYGLAALEMGHAQEAVFALERVVAMIPEDHRARVELARAHFILGNYKQSNYLFQQVLTSEPPPRVKENIQGFLEQIEQRAKMRNFQLSSSVELKLGYDSNVNSATEENLITLPIGLTLQLGDDSRQLSDDFFDLSLNASYLSLLRKDMGYFLSASMNQRSNVKYSEFDVRMSALSGGYIYKSGGYSIRVPLQYQYLQVDETKFRASSSLGLEWSMVPLKNSQLVVFSQFAQQRHIKTEETRDVDARLFGIAYSQTFLPCHFTSSLSLYGGIEKPVDEGLEHYGRTYQGGRVAGQWRVEGGA